MQTETFMFVMLLAISVPASQEEEWWMSGVTSLDVDNFVYFMTDENNKKSKYTLRSWEDSGINDK